MNDTVHRILQWIFRDALTVRDKAIQKLKADRKALELEVAILRTRSQR